MTRVKYMTGFLLSLILTLLAYVSVTDRLASGFQLVVLLSVLAVVQAAVQLVFFLHVDGGSGESRDRRVALYVMLGMILILIVGSIWIMRNMNYNMIQLSPDAKNKVMLDQYDKGGF